jgi:hypothetical protein
LDKCRIEELDRCAPDALARMARKALNLARIRISIRAEKPIPEEMNHGEIIVRVPVMNEMQLLFASEPCKPLKP